ncbi:hypothetical protein LTR37_020544, partial [Vermiconidia calcicola]
MPDPPQQPTANRKRTASNRVIPAIPLALSKPKASKPKARPSHNALVGGSSGTHEDIRAEAPNAQATPEPIVNGNAHKQVEVQAGSGAEYQDEAANPLSSDTPGSRGSASMPLSNGATPDPTTMESAQPSTPPADQEFSVTASPASSRKPTDRFDMRHIRTELPPAFVPSAEQQTPKSAASSQPNQPTSHSHAHPTNPSTSSIVFGGQDSSTSSPPPSISAGSGFPPPQAPGMGAPQPPYFVPQGHSHHASEPYGQRTYQPAYPQPNMQWNPRQGYWPPASQGQHYHPHAHMPFRYPPREIFTPAETQQPNGRTSSSRSASQASSATHDHQRAPQSLQSPLSPDGSRDNGKPPFQGPNAAFFRHAHPRPPPHFNPQVPPPPPFSNHFNADLESADALRAHVQSHFANPELADCCLKVEESINGSQQRIDGHRIILSRSPTLSALIQAKEGSSPEEEVPIQLEGHYLRADALMIALKYLYGGSLLQIDYHRPQSAAGEHVPSNVDRMSNALHYIAMGAWLKVPAIASRGIEVAGGLLHWDTVASALAFALHGGLSPIWTVDDGSEDRASTSSSEDSLSRSELASMPTYDPYSTHLLQRILDFAVHMFPMNFYLDSSAPQIASCPRLPPLAHGHESRPSRSDPRLSQIRFGEVPSDDHQRPSFATTTVSSVLLSLPFSLLKCVLEHYDLAAKLGPETVASIMRQVVAEREVRRMRTFRSRDAGQLDDGSTDSQLLQNLYWQEFVEESAQHRAGFRLARRKRDIDTPPSSGACSERN